jgi:hypothetical protein
MRKLLLLFLLMQVLAAGAQPAYEFWPGAQYDPAAPAIQKVLGYEPGERITRPEDIVRYMEALTKYAPDRVRIFDYAKSWEGRRLIYVAIGAPDRIKQLDSLQRQYRQFADPLKTSEAQAKRMAQTLPALIWLAYGVHGDEISSPDAAMLTAYHLLAAKNDPMVNAIFDKDVVIIDPLQNPDGRARFVHSFEIAEGRAPDSDPLAAEHNESWPGGRTNHYYIDMNRDWFALSQPETKGRVKSLLEWLPQIYVDLHEMGANGTYYFSPESNPYNPNMTSGQKQELFWFGKNNAKWFDRFGFNYFTREEYDAFYPGYGAGWPAFYGAIGMTYEEASARGLVMRRYDNSPLFYRDTVRRHFITSLSTLQTAAEHHDELMMNFYRYRASAIEEGRTEAVRAYLLKRANDTGMADELARTLLEQGIAIQRFRASEQVEGESVPAGSYLISLAQPEKRLIRTLLDKQTSMAPDFLKSEEERRLRRQNTEIYDVTAWSLPLQFNVESVALKAMPKADIEPVTIESLPKGEFIDTNEAIDYLVPWNTAGARFLSEALQLGIHVLSSDHTFSQSGRQYPRGSLIIAAHENPSNLADTLRMLSKNTGAEVIATQTSWIDRGPNFGSHWVRSIRRPRVAMAWDMPTSALSAGALRFVIERKFNYPVTVIRTQQLASADLTRYQVLIFPDGGDYASILKAAGAERIKAWVRSGGTLITICDAMRFAADPKLGLLSLTREESPTARRTFEKKDTKKVKDEEADSDEEKEPEDARAPGTLLSSVEDYQKSIQPLDALPDSSQGVLLKAVVDQGHWVTDGSPRSVYALVEGNLIFSPLKQDDGVNAAYFAAPDQVLASGYLWDEYRKQIAFKPFIVVQPEGNGFTIGFTADPSFRTYMDGLELFLMNAVFRGPAHASTPEGE